MDSSFVPCCSYDRETDAERDAQTCPPDGGYGFEERADLAKEFVRLSGFRAETDGLVRFLGPTYIEGFAAASEEHI